MGLVGKDHPVYVHAQGRGLSLIHILEANGIRQSAVQYTDDMLKSLQNILNHTLETAQAPFNSFLSAVRSSYDIVTSNRGELASGIIEPADEQTTEE